MKTIATLLMLLALTSSHSAVSAQEYMPQEHTIVKLTFNHVWTKGKTVLESGKDLNVKPLRDDYMIGGNLVMDIFRYRKWSFGADFDVSRYDLGYSLPNSFPYSSQSGMLGVGHYISDIATGVRASYNFIATQRFGLLLTVTPLVGRIMLYAKYDVYDTSLSNKFYNPCETCTNAYLSYPPEVPNKTTFKVKLGAEFDWYFNRWLGMGIQFAYLQGFIDNYVNRTLIIRDKHNTPMLAENTGLYSTTLRGSSFQYHWGLRFRL